MLALQSKSQIATSLEAHADLLREHFPSVSLMIVEGHPTVDEQMPLPKNFDLYGYDCYAPFDNCFGRSNEEIYRALRARVVSLNEADNRQRKLALVPNTSQIVDTRTGLTDGRAESQILAELNRSYNMVKEDPLCIMFAAWLWEGYEEGSTYWRGSRGLPSVRERLEQIAAEITAKTKPVWTKPPAIELFISRGRVGEGLFFAWSALGATECVSLTDVSEIVYQPQGFLLGGIQTQPTNARYEILCRGPHGETRASHPLVVDP